MQITCMINLYNEICLYDTVECSISHRSVMVKDLLFPVRQHWGSVGKLSLHSFHLRNQVAQGTQTENPVWKLLTSALSYISLTSSLPSQTLRVYSEHGMVYNGQTGHSIGTRIWQYIHLDLIHLFKICLMMQSVAHTT
jgi:hypothetical protein